MRGAFGSIALQSQHLGLFEPAPGGNEPSGLRQRPRPFVFRASYLDGSTISAGAPFSFAMHLFDTRAETVAAVVDAFSHLSRDGLGPGRRPVQFLRAEFLNHDGTTSSAADPAQAALIIDLSPAPQPVSRVRIRFDTPTELKSGDQLAPQPLFSILAARLRDRISTLSQFYGNGPLSLDFSAFGQRASTVRLLQASLQPVAITRFSTRTGQIHPLGGFVGEAEYAGDLGEFLPFLRAAFWTGVGRQTVWGKGQISIVETSE